MNAKYISLVEELLPRIAHTELAQKFLDVLRTNGDLELFAMQIGSFDTEMHSADYVLGMAIQVARCDQTTESKETAETRAVAEIFPFAVDRACDWFDRRSNTDYVHAAYCTIFREQESMRGFYTVLVNAIQILGITKEETEAQGLVPLFELESYRENRAMATQIFEQTLAEYRKRNDTPAINVVPRATLLS